MRKIYISTRGNYPSIPASQAIKLGMVPTGGLFVPAELPSFSLAALQDLAPLSYQELAVTLLTSLLDDYPPEKLRILVERAYHAASFDDVAVTPLYSLEDNLHILELWHGPTAAFKDVALQLMPHLLGTAIQMLPGARETVILVATSGDTGKAALEGFKDVPGIRIIVFYPHRGVSKIQELQMKTTAGANTHVVAVRGNFDDCQTAVKAIFADAEFGQELGEKGFALSSANSINWGRLSPQIVYYFAAYLQLLRQGKLTLGDHINFVVPTGNFGNILAGWYAAQMGLPVQKLICASNENKILTDFFATGIYDRRRTFHSTISPSMDILISSNLERFLFEMNGRDAGGIVRWMEDLQTRGVFEVDAATRQRLAAIIWGGYATEAETLATINRVFTENKYTLDPHTAVGMKVYRDYQDATGDTAVTVLAATANPFKFNTSVLKAIAGPAAVVGRDELAILDELAQVTGLPLHPGLAGLAAKPIRHEQVISKEEIQTTVKRILEVG